MNLTKGAIRVVVFAWFPFQIGCRIADETSFLAAELDRSPAANERELLARHCGVDDLATYTYSYSGPAGVLSVWWEVWEDGRLKCEVARSTISLGPSRNRDGPKLVRDGTRAAHGAHDPHSADETVKRRRVHCEGTVVASWDTECSSQGETVFRFVIDIQNVPASPRSSARWVPRDYEFPGAKGFLRFDESLSLAPTDRTSSPCFLGKTVTDRTRILRATYFTAPRISKVWSIPPWEQQGVVAFFLKMREEENFRNPTEKEIAPSNQREEDANRPKH